MISILGVSYGFLSPITLLLLPVLVGGLIYAYLRRKRGEKLLVSSVILLKELRRSSFSRKRFVPPLRFFFELLLLLLLLFACAGLFQENSQKKIAILVDNSFSMGAHSEQEAGQSLLEAAKVDIENSLSALALNTKVDVYQTSPITVQLNSDSLSPDSASALIKGIELAYAPDNLVSAMNRLSTEGHYSKILVFSDQRSALASAETQKKQGARDGRFEIVSLGPKGIDRTLDNLAISNLSLSKSEDDQQESLLVSISSYAQMDSKVRVSLERYLPESESFKELANKEAKIPKLGQVKIDFDELSENIEGYRVRLQVIGSAARVDTLSEDNVAYFALKSNAQRVRFVGPIAPSLLGLSAIKTLEYDFIEADKFSDWLIKEPEPYKYPFIFHRIVPEKFPEANALFVFPVGENLLFPGRLHHGQSPATRWQGLMPILTYVNVPALELTETTSFKTPDWAEEVLHTSSGPVIIAGEDQGFRYAAVGFELFPFEGKKSPVLSVLTLNLLKWLSNIAAGVGYQPANSSLKIGGEVDSVRYVGAKTIYTKGSDIPPSVLLTQSGLALIAANDGNKRLVAVNYFDPDESDLGAIKEVELPRIQMGLSDQSKESRTALSTIITYLVLLLLALEILYAFINLRIKRQGLSSGI